VKTLPSNPHTAEHFRYLIDKMDSDRDVLPSSIKPVHYSISVFDLQWAPTWSYQGTVQIKLLIKEEVREIQINTLELDFSEAELLLSNKSVKASNITFNEKQHRATITFSEAIPATDHATLSIKYSGTMNRKMAGFYRSGYNPVVPAAKSVPTEGDLHFMFSTQFESCDARRAFPCFDEPALKATFDFEIEVPEDQIALSNMPEKATKPSKAGWKTVSFDTSPVMSTYLLAWAFGDFGYGKLVKSYWSQRARRNLSKTINPTSQLVERRFEPCRLPTTMK
jgi:aminopeptidase N